MRNIISESVAIPEGISCEVKDGNIVCSKGGVSLSRVLEGMGIVVTVKQGVISIECAAGNKMHRSKVQTLKAHLVNMFVGLQKAFVYSLEACNVHFPMTMKVEKGFLIINNFLGEKTPRKAKILEGVVIEVKGQKITLTSADREAAGQTAANIEKATKIRNRDRRVFQDGIYITAKPGRNA